MWQQAVMHAAVILPWVPGEWFSAVVTLWKRSTISGLQRQHKDQCLLSRVHNSRCIFRTWATVGTSQSYCRNRQSLNWSTSYLVSEYPFCRWCSSKDITKFACKFRNDFTSEFSLGTPGRSHICSARCSRTSFTFIACCSKGIVVCGQGKVQIMVQVCNMRAFPGPCTCCQDSVAHFSPKALPCCILVVCWQPCMVTRQVNH